MTIDAVSLLVITPIGVPPYSARGLTQTLTHIAAAGIFRRSLTTGRLINIAAPEFKLYKSTITCTDQEAPAFDGVWPGDLVTVDCVKRLKFLTAGGTPQRPVVPGSLQTEGIFTSYRPRILFMVTGFSDDFVEFEAQGAWQLDLEEYSG